MDKPAWIKPGIEGGSKGCLCCGVMHQTLQPGAVIAVGFGAATAMKGNEVVYDEQDVPHDSDFATCADIEKLALADPDHDWRISYYAPLYEAVYQRHGEGHWVLIEKGQGFA